MFFRCRMVTFVHMGKYCQCFTTGTIDRMFLLNKAPVRRLSLYVHSLLYVSLEGPLGLQQKSALHLLFSMYGCHLKDL
jgi:hypothetical protein